MPLTPADLRNFTPAFPANPQRLAEVHEARLAKVVTGYNDLTLSANGSAAAGPAAHNVRTALHDLGENGQADVLAATTAIAATAKGRDSKGKAGKVPVIFNADRRQLDPNLPSQPPPPRGWVKGAGHAIADAGRSAKHKTKKTAHHGHYSLPAPAALTFLAGAHGERKAFELALHQPAVFEADLIKIADKLDDQPFFTPDCLRSAVEYAAAEQAAGAVNPAGPMLGKAQRLIAIYLRSLPTKQMRADADHLFTLVLRTIHPPLIPLLIPVDAATIKKLSEYRGALLGLCLAGLFQYGKMDETDRQKKRHRIILAFTALSAAVSAGTFTGAGPLATVIGAAGPELANLIVKDAHIDTAVRKIEGNVIRALREVPETYLDKAACIDMLQNTIMRSGH